MHHELFEDYKLMTAGCAIGALAYISLGTYWAAVGLLGGYVAGMLFHSYLNLAALGFHPVETLTADDLGRTEKTQKAA